MDISVKNPFKRVREERGLTLHTMAVRVGVSRYLLIRTEQGCFPSPPPIVENYYVNQLKISRQELLEDYHDFQRATRQHHGTFLGPVGDFNDADHPFTYWRSSANKNEFNLTEVSKRLCVSQPVLYRFEHYPRQQGSVPAQLLSALTDAGYTTEDLTKLKDLYAKHRKFLREGANTLAKVG